MSVYFLTFNLMDNSTSDYFIELSNRLSKENKVVVITSKIRETNIKLESRIKVLKWPSPRPTRMVDFIFLCSTVRKYRPDTMISMFGFVNLFLIVGKLFGVKNRIAWIRSLSTQFPQSKFLVFRRTLIYKLSTHIIANSKATQYDASKFFNIDLKKITVLPNSVKDYSHLLHDVPMDLTKVLYVGRLHPTKGVDVLIKAFGMVQSEINDLCLEIIGDGPQKEELTTLSKSLGLESKINFLGTKKKEQVLKAYKNSYCTVIPSFSEAFGFTVIEAMSAKTCVIGAKNTGIMEIIIPNVTGLFFETGNAMDLAGQLKKLFNNRDLRDLLAEGGYENFKKLYESNYAIERDYQFFHGLEDSSVIT